ncbi:MAG: 50S ribosomal protein L5 [Deltaproteobacteria bacterium]|nr:50S ribosomal protein L5 [Deltaproteobacteria bacterium]
MTPVLIKELGYKNPMQVPRLEKIVVNMGLGEAIQNIKILDNAVAELAMIVGQRPVVTKARKSIATFKLRQQEKMYEFLDRLVNIAIPRIRDFRGISPKSFDGRGNFSMGINEHYIFTEIDYDKIDKVKGMNITIVTTAKTDDEARRLLKLMGVPFRN